MKKGLISAALLLAVVLSSCNSYPSDNSSVPFEPPEASFSSSESQSESQNDPQSTPSNEESKPQNSDSSISHQEREDLSKYPGYNALSGSLKEAYSEITHALFNFNTSINISRYNLSRTDVSKVVGYIFNDRPEIFWLEKEYSLIASEDYVYAITFKNSFTSAKTAEKKALVDSAVSSYVSALSGKGTYEKIKGAHDMLIGATSYKSGTDAHNICGVFIDKKAVCEGYAKAFQLIMQKLGIPCYLVHGKSGGVDHIWNLVSVDGKYYHIDLTLDDPVIKSGTSITSYTYFLLNDEQIKKNHSISNEYNIPLPASQNEAMNYYVKENRYIASYNTDNITSIIVSDINSGRKFSEMRFSSKADLDKAKQKLALTDLKRAVSNKTGKTVSWNIIETNGDISPPVYDLILKLSY